MATYKRHRYLLLTLDPVHIGAGGYRLGRVDLSIVREPGTKVPKIPGTSLSGAIRSYAAMLLGQPDCAGQKDHCGRANCPICYTFGYVKGDEETEEQEARSGTVNIFDARLVLFPVHSMAGPVWVTTWDRLDEAGFVQPPDRQDPPADGALFTWERADPLNLGWLMLGGTRTAPPTVPNGWNVSRWNRVKERLVIVSEALFGHVVNSNLEVRTSVSIDPRTGAAESGALFTYEALPRAAFLFGDVVLDDYREAFPKNNAQNWQSPLAVVRAGLDMAAWLGIGGMSTRGFGRIDVVGEALNQNK